MLWITNANTQFLSVAIGVSDTVNDIYRMRSDGSWYGPDAGQNYFVKKKAMFSVRVEGETEFQVSPLVVNWFRGNRQTSRKGLSCRLVC